MRPVQSNEKLLTNVDPIEAVWYTGRMMVKRLRKH
jgi:hypothetical protein